LVEEEHRLDKHTVQKHCSMLSVVHVCVCVYRQQTRNFSYFSGLKLAKLDMADVPPPEGHRKITAFNEMFTYL